jgi:Lipocalin-like domain
MKLRVLIGLLIVIFVTANVRAADPKLDGAYKLVGLKFPGGSQSDADVKGMIVVHGKYMAFVRANVGRKTWDQNEPEAERAKKMVAAYLGMAATCGTIEVQGDVISLTQLAQSSPASMGATTKWKYKLQGKSLTLEPVPNPGVEFTFERVP